MVVAVVSKSLLNKNISRVQASATLERPQDFLGAALNAKAGAALTPLKSILWVQRGGRPEPRPAFPQCLEKEWKRADGGGVQLLYLDPSSSG